MQSAAKPFTSDFQLRHEKGGGNARLTYRWKFMTVTLSSQFGEYLKKKKKMFDVKSKTRVFKIMFVPLSASQYFGAYMKGT